MSFASTDDGSTGEASSSFARVLAKYKVEGVTREDLLQDNGGPAGEWSKVLRDKCDAHSLETTSI